MTIEHRVAEGDADGDGCRCSDSDRLQAEIIIRRYIAGHGSRRRETATHRFGTATCGLIDRRAAPCHRAALRTRRDLRCTSFRRRQAIRCTAGSCCVVSLSSLSNGAVNTSEQMHGGSRERIVLVCCVSVSLPLNAFAQGPLLWELQEDINGGVDLARAITLSGRAAVVVGNGGVPLEGTDESDLVIQSAQSDPQELSGWSDQTFLSIGSVEPLFTTSPQEQSLCGWHLREPNDVRSAFLVRAYSVPTGELLWQNVWHASPGVDTDHPTGIFAGPTAVIVVEYSEECDARWPCRRCAGLRSGERCRFVGGSGRAAPALM